MKPHTHDISEWNKWWGAYELLSFEAWTWAFNLNCLRRGLESCICTVILPSKLHLLEHFRFGVLEAFSRLKILGMTLYHLCVLKAYILCLLMWCLSQVWPWGVPPEVGASVALRGLTMPGRRCPFQLANPTLTAASGTATFFTTAYAQPLICCLVEILMFCGQSISVAC